MREACSCSERGLDALAEDEICRHVFVGPKSDYTSAHRAERLRLSAVNRSPPDPARLARDRVGEARDDAGRGPDLPRAARMPAQAAEVRHLVERDAAAREVGLAGGAGDVAALAPDLVGAR